MQKKLYIFFIILMKIHTITISSEENPTAIAIFNRFNPPSQSKLDPLHAQQKKFKEPKIFLWSKNHVKKSRAHLQRPFFPLLYVDVPRLTLPTLEQRKKRLEEPLADSVARKLSFSSDNDSDDEQPSALPPSPSLKASLEDFPLISPCHPCSRLAYSPFVLCLQPAAAD